MGMIPFLGLNAQNVVEINTDTVFCISIIYFYNNNQNEPESYTFLLPVHEKCCVNISNHDTFFKTINIGTYSISNPIASLYPMIKASFPDSSSSFQKESYNSSMIKWLHYSIEANNGKGFYTKNNDYFIIAIAKIIAITKKNVNGFPFALGVIKDILPVSLNDNCIKDDLMIISEKLFE